VGIEYSNSKFLKAALSRFFILNDFQLLFINYQSAVFVKLVEINYFTNYGRKNFNQQAAGFICKGLSD